MSSIEDNYSLQILVGYGRNLCFTREAGAESIGVGVSNLSGLQFQ